jgi:hypothetical protein
LRKDNLLLQFLILAVVVFNLYGYWFNLGLHNTDLPDEDMVMHEGQAMLAGNHKVGIVTSTHYPNGPTYILLPFLKLGISDRESLRWIPTIIAVAAEILLLYAFYKSNLKFLWKVYLITVAAILFYQPGIRNWVGSLHEQSYAFSITITLISMAVMGTRNLWLFGLVGFVSGWIGYDYIPAQTSALFGVAITQTLFNSSR